MMEKSKLDDKEGKSVDTSHYRGMIGTLIYSSASRPDYNFAICMVPGISHAIRKALTFAVQKIFQYLRRKQSIGGIWEIDVLLGSSKQKSSAISSTKRTILLWSAVVINSAFQITYDVLEIYMQEFKATATVHHQSIHLKMNNKKHIVNLEHFREMLQICPKLPDHQFEEPPFEEEIRTFLRDLGHSGEIKVITDVNVNKLHQPWRSFAAVINKCLSDYAYLLWEDFFYQVENKNVKRSNEMYYPRFTKVIVNFFMTKDSSIPETSVKKKQAGSDKTKTLSTAKGKRLKTLAKAAKPAKKKQPAKTSKAKGLTVLSEVALTEAEQMKLATKRSLIQTHSSHASGSGADEGTGGTPRVPDVPTYESDDEQISWKSSDEEDDDDNNDDDEDTDDDDDDDDDADNQDDEGQDDDNEKTDSDNDGDEIDYPKFSTHDQEERQDEEDNEE
ncbi:hypothetical protein Tco_0393470, partial [Tanacetum coccineum]